MRGGDAGPELQGVVDAAAARHQRQQELSEA